MAEKLLIGLIKYQLYTGRRSLDLWVHAQHFICKNFLSRKVLKFSKLKINLVLTFPEMVYPPPNNHHKSYSTKKIYPCRKPVLHHIIRGHCHGFSENESILSFSENPWGPIRSPEKNVHTYRRIADNEPAENSLIKQGSPWLKQSRSEPNVAFIQNKLSSLFNKSVLHSVTCPIIYTAHLINTTLHSVWNAKECHGMLKSCCNATLKNQLISAIN